MKMVESTRYKGSPYTAHTALKVPSVGKAMVRAITKKIRQECKFLCAKSSRVSVLRKGVKHFQWRNVTQELLRPAPTLYAVLRAACMRPTRKKISRRYVLSVAAAGLLKGRNQFLCRMQKHILTLLYAGHSSKMVSLKLCVDYGQLPFRHLSD